MASFGGFYKGEKKKKKKDNQNSAQMFSDKPVFSLPKMIEKKKKER